MAKVRLPLMSGEARGKFGKSIIYRRGGVVSRTFVPRNPKTAAQEAHRLAFKEYYMASLTQAQADLLYAAIAHLHDERYLQSVPQQDHGGLSGLSDDDHSQYYNQTRGDERYLRSVPQQDHGGLSGLSDDDHSQYYNQTRGDARYSLTGHTHEAAAAGWRLIEDKDLTTGTAASFDFQSIPGTFKHLKVLLDIRSNNSGSSGDQLMMKLNNDTGNHYIGAVQYGGSKTQYYTAQGPINIGWCAENGCTADYFDNFELTILNYTQTNHFHSGQCRGTNVVGAINGGLYIYDAVWKFLVKGSAISRVTLYPNTGSAWMQWSRATLFGLV